MAVTTGAKAESVAIARTHCGRTNPQQTSPPVACDVSSRLLYPQQTPRYLLPCMAMLAMDGVLPAIRFRSR